MSKLWFVVAAVVVALVPATLTAQEAATVTGRVTDAGGNPVAGASVFIQQMNIGTLTRPDGGYLLTVPAARLRPGQPVSLTAQSIGYRAATGQVTLQPGTSVTQNFTLDVDALRLEEIVVTGIGGTERTRVAMAATVNPVSQQEVLQSNESNIVAALAGKAPNVEVQRGSGDPGAGAYFRIRGANTVWGGTQPLIIVDGVPITNYSASMETTVAGVQVTNRASDLNPADIENIEILKGPAAASLYGSQAASGVVVITTRRGRAGQTQATWRTSYVTDRVNQQVPLQTLYQEGLSLAPFDEEGQLDRQVVSWGEPLACAQVDPVTRRATGPGTCREGVDFFDHRYSLFRTGQQLDNNLTLSGGTDRTTYYLSVGRNDHIGVIDGNSEYHRTSARLRGSHLFGDHLTLGGNFFYADAAQNMVQQGSNISGLMLGLLRTPPEWDNRQYIDPETGLHRSYRCHEGRVACPGGGNFFNPASGRGYDNPFWIAREMPNTSDIGRTIATFDMNYQPLGWLTATYTFGVDYSSDRRTTLKPKSSSDFPAGQILRGDFFNRLLSSNASLTGRHQFSPLVGGSLTFSQLLSQEDYNETVVNGQNLIAGTDQLDFAVDRIPNEFTSRVRTEGYIAQTTADIANQLYLTASVRYDGSSTFGGQQRFAYPALQAAWVFSEQFNLPFVDLARVRASWGVTGKQPPVFSNVSAFQTTIFTDSWLTPRGLQTIYQGREGVITQATLGNQEIKPERTTGAEAGVEFTLLDNRANFSLTWYDERTRDVILDLDAAPSTGYTARWTNAASIDNRGLELTVGFNPVRMSGFSWDVQGQWARNKSCVRDVAGSDFISLGGFIGSEVGLPAPERDAAGNITRCYQYNTFWVDDFVRFGRGMTIGDVNIDTDPQWAGWAEGDLFIGEDGFPMYDATLRPIGNANPDWTASIRNTFTLLNDLRISSLVDFSFGAQRWNGTKGALYYFGTHRDTERWRGVGQDTVFPGRGPGAGETVTLNWDTWALGGLGSGFTGPASQYIEDADWVKLRDITVSYNVPARFTNRLGFGAAEVGFTARNLWTWTNYDGVDPESNLSAVSAARGLDYFHNPQTRSFGVTFSLTR